MTVFGRIVLAQQTFRDRRETALTKFGCELPSGHPIAGVAPAGSWAARAVMAASRLAP